MSYEEDLFELLWAIKRDDVSVVRNHMNLVDAGFNVTVGSSRAPFLYVASMCNASKVVAFLIEHGVDPNCRDSDGDTPLHSACGENNKECVRVLVANGADVNAVDAKGLSPLLVACYMDSYESAVILLENGSRIDGVGGGSLSVLSCLCKNKRVQGSIPEPRIVGLLLQMGADVDDLYNEGFALAHFAQGYLGAEVIPREAWSNDYLREQYLAVVQLQ